MLATRIPKRPLAHVLRPPAAATCAPSRACASSCPPDDTPLDDGGGPPDHRRIGRQQHLFTTSPYSPGSPIFLPAGTRVFSRLVDLVRAQYARHGFDEVITPNMYKAALWERSGHLQNYAAHMYAVRGGVAAATAAGEAGKRKRGGGAASSSSSWAGGNSADPDEQYSLKPMNCPGHCLIFASTARSYRDLPLRFADFGALHRNEVAGALTGLTRVRRFHQDDGHVFCRPAQVRAEIARELGLVRDVYGALGLEYRLVLSTRPGDGKMLGAAEDWDRAEDALRQALDDDAAKRSAAAAATAATTPPPQWTVGEGDGAFYGPKIDVVVRDTTGKEHQTATIQLDFQLPKRFELAYEAPAPEHEARAAAHEASPEDLARYGPVTPVLVHRAVLGSVERIMALLAERHAGRWPFWLNPRQVALLPINQTAEVLGWTARVRDVLVGVDDAEGASALVRRPTGLSVEIDDTAVPLAKKVRDALAAGVGAVCVIGRREADERSVRFKNRSWSPRELVACLRDMVDGCGEDWAPVIKRHAKKDDQEGREK
jgi:threonyl-tRNA synthetase